MAKPNNQTYLGQLLKDWRYLNKLDLRTVAAQIGIASSTLLRIEAGGLFDVETWLKIQAWLFSGPDVSDPTKDPEAVAAMLSMRKQTDPGAPDAVVAG